VGTILCVKDVACYHFFGQVSFDEVAVKIREFLLREPFKNSIWDYREADIDFKEEQLQAFAEYVRSFGKHKEGGKAVIIAPPGYKHDLATSFLAHAHDSPVEIRIFQTTEEAVHWLAEE
jgi:hypothetical protein